MEQPRKTFRPPRRLTPTTPPAAMTLSPTELETVKAEAMRSLMRTPRPARRDGRTIPSSVPIDPFLAAVLLDLVYIERDRLALQRARAPEQHRPWLNRQINKLDRWSRAVVRVAWDHGWHDALDVADRRRLPPVREP